MDVFTHPDQEDWDHAKEKARELLHTILPEDAWTRLEAKGIIEFAGRRGTYVISPHSQTEIRDLATGRRIAYGCLQLSIPAPADDRMAAEYLLLKNAEDVYWRTANIFAHNCSGIAVLFLSVFDIALFVHLLMEVIRLR